jgi:hypothetical protein
MVTILNAFTGRICMGPTHICNTASMAVKSHICRVNRRDCCVFFRRVTREFAQTRPNVFFPTVPTSRSFLLLHNILRCSLCCISRTNGVPTQPTDGIVVCSTTDDNDADSACEPSPSMAFRRQLRSSVLLQLPIDVTAEEEEEELPPH